MSSCAFYLRFRAKPERRALSNDPDEIANIIREVGWVALRPNPPAFSGRPQHKKAAPRALRGATARSASRPTFLMRLPCRRQIGPVNNLGRELKRT